MKRNTRNDENDSDQNLHGLRKMTYWKKYGVKRFPYPVRRRFSPLVYQSFDGGIIISNDVFGLTIRQFEEMYKACLDRRKAHEQYILNLRYPDKSSDEYLEYLENRTDCKKDYRSCDEIDLKERFLYEYLVNTAGTEIDIRKRQQLFIIQDLITNATHVYTKAISSGSLAEGLDLPGSDTDIMLVINNFDIIQNERNIKHPLQWITLVMETDNDHPGFTRLRLIPGAYGDAVFGFESTRKGSYLSAKEFVYIMNQKRPHLQLSSHGPCLSDKNQITDYAFCIQSQYLPFTAMQWASRYRKQWPPNSAIDKIIKYGCLLVPIGPRTLPDCNVLWRLSFSVAEKQLVHSFNYTQLLCYCLLKLTLKHIVNTNDHAKGLLCSYFLKTVLFWVSEEEDIDTFQLPKLFYCFTHCINKLISWVNNCFCPNYFIPEHNMFLGKINPDNNKILIKVLDSITMNGMDGLMKNLYSSGNENYRVLSIKKECSFIMLDFLFYRICRTYILEKISRCLKALILTESLNKSKSSTFIIDVCKYFHAEISQNAAQLLPPPTITTETYSIHKWYHRHLTDGTKTDAVSGWLLYASFYYVTGQYNVTLRLTDYVLSRCSPGMMLLCCGNYNEIHRNIYRNYVHSTMTLNDRMKIATVRQITYLPHSSLIPAELQLEVKDHEIMMPPTVMPHCLRFLCYHHLGDISNRRQALSDLYSTVKCEHYILSYSISLSITVLGVCYEITGDKEAAYHCYDDIKNKRH
ncbi:unnamed protein product [Mytilus coruscus]|uniref:Mab-21-like HhH/H2TH-like domain-containing protein n=1 Tax=Mytilus coruscus TaxID=42192 RepID=A0A6J8AL77_MYTCO|nr:unnamed protein product [Mytilus coruscus]